MSKFKNILILAAGDSTRFWPLKRKSYFPFVQKPLLQHQLSNLKNYSESLSVIVNQSDYQFANSIIKQIKNGNNYKFQVINQKQNLKGQGGAILSAKNKIKAEVLILNAEDIFKFDILNQCIDTARDKNLDYLCLAKKVNSYFPGGYLATKKNKLDQIIEKPQPKKTPSNLVKLVVDYFKDFSQLILALEKTKTNRDDQYEQAINVLLRQTNRREYILYDDFWYPLKYPWHVLGMIQYFLDPLKNEIKLGKNVKIAQTAKIVGPCFIDDNTIVGDYALVRQSHIGKNCLIGGYSEVARSYLAEGVSLHRNYIGDSVLDTKVLFGAEATTANFRFDGGSVKSFIKSKKVNTNLAKFGAIVGAGSKIGVNSTLLPGVKIGSNTLIGPGETIYEDVKDNTFLFKTSRTKNKMGGGSGMAPNSAQ